jgi:hypothetical protein
MRRMRTPRSLGLLPLLLLGAACGKGGGGGSSPAAADPTIPVIASLRVSLGRPCTLVGTGGLAGTIKTVAFDYADADGNLRGGVVELTGTADVGGTTTLTGAIPSPAVGITGTTSGTITVTSCLHFGSNSSFTKQVRVADSTGKASNALTTKLPNPSGLPLLPHGTDTAPREGLEFAQ